VTWLHRAGPRRSSKLARENEYIGMSRKAKSKRPIYFNNPECDKLLAIIMALAGELAVTRERLDTLSGLPAPMNCSRLRRIRSLPYPTAPSASRRPPS
jgi:hypothetical protein